MVVVVSARFLVPGMISLLFLGLVRELLVTAEVCIPLLHPDGYHVMLVVCGSY